MDECDTLSKDQIEAIREYVTAPPSSHIAQRLVATIYARDAEIDRLKAENARLREAMPSNAEHRLFVEAVDRAFQGSHDLTKYDSAWSALRRLITECDRRDIDAARSMASAGKCEACNGEGHGVTMPNDSRVLVFHECNACHGTGRAEAAEGER